MSYPNRYTYRNNGKLCRISNKEHRSILIKAHVNTVIRNNPYGIFLLIKEIKEHFNVI